MRTKCLITLSMAFTIVSAPGLTNASQELTDEQIASDYLQQFISGKSLSGYPQTTSLNGSSTTLASSSEPAQQGARQQSTRTQIPNHSAQQLFDELFDFTSRFERDFGLNQTWRDSLSRYVKVPADISTLKQPYLRLKAKHVLYLEHFRTVERKLEGAGLSSLYAAKLQQAEVEYRQSIAAIISEFDELLLGDSDVSENGLGDNLRATFDLNSARALVAELRQSEKNQSVHVLRNNQLPYRSLSLPAQPLVLEPTIIPSYLQNSDGSPLVDDSPSAEDSQTADLSEEVLKLAEELEYDPIKLFEFVNSQIDTELYYGSMKGATATLLQKAGNSTDQASLLVGLYRASGIPARHVSGVIRMDTVQLKNLVGSEDVNQAVIALRRAGIPLSTVIEGGAIREVEIQHSWVSAFIPYANYRGATVDATGQAWLPLMPAIKAYETANMPAVLTEAVVDELRQTYLSSTELPDVLLELDEKTKQYLSSIGNTAPIEDQLRSHTRAVANAGYLPNSLPVEVVAVTAEYTQIPDSLIHKVRFYAHQTNRSDSVIVMDVRKPVAQLINKDISISYQAATEESQKLALSLGGINNVPLYLMDLRARVSLQGRVIDVADEAIASGVEHLLSIDIISPSGTYSVDKTVYAGGFHAVGIGVQKGTQQNNVALDANQEDSVENLAGKILNQVARRYLADWSDAEGLVSDYSSRIIVRPVPTLVFASNDLELESLLGQPQHFKWRGVTLDAAFRVTESVAAHADVLVEKSFTQISAFLGSNLEHAIFERYFSVSSISADKGLALVAESGGQILNLSSADISTLETQLVAHSLGVVAEVRKWLELDYSVTIPVEPNNYINWSGSVWLVEDLNTGHAGYFIARSLAGGATASDWPSDLADALENYDLDNINTNPSEAAQITLFADGDFQIVAAGAETEPLSVLVSDERGHVVKGALVSFKLSSGAGKFVTSDEMGDQIEVDSLSVFTDARGHAQAVYKNPEVIRDSQIVSFLSVDDDEQVLNEVGLSYITAEVIKSERERLAADDFYTVITKPAEPSELTHLVAEGQGLFGAVEQGLGFERIQVSDEFGNSVAGVSLSVDINPIVISGTGVIKYEHRILTSDCQGIVTIQSSCGQAHTELVSNVYGKVFVGIIFGRVNASDDSDRVISAQYPIAVTLPNGPVIDLDYRASRGARVVFRGPSSIAASNVDETYQGSAQTKIFLDDDEELLDQEVTITAPGYTGATSFTGSELLDYKDMRLGGDAVLHFPKSDWTVLETKSDGSTESFSAIFNSPFPVAAVHISPVLPEPIELNFNLEYTQFGDFTYTAMPAGYEPFYALFDIYEDGDLLSSHVVKARGGESLMNGVASLPPLAFDVDAEYEGQFVFNKGDENNEVKSDMFPLPVTAPIIRSAGGGGALIIDEINDANCTVRNPEFTLNLVQEAKITIETRAPGSTIETTFLSSETLPAGEHVFDRNDLGFRRAFLNEGKTGYMITAEATSDGKIETKSGTFSFSVRELASLPIGSPNYKDVNLFRGSLNLSRSDVQVPARGAGIEWTRSYSSSSRNAASLGLGWSHNYDSYLQVSECGWVYVTGGAKGGTVFFPIGGGAYRAGKGFHSTLLRDDEGWRVVTTGGMSYRYSKVFPINGRFEAKPRFYLDSIEDKNGNVTTLSYSPATHSAPQIETITDSSERQIELTYLTQEEVAAAILENPPTGPIAETFGPYALFDFPRNVIKTVEGLDYLIEYEYDDNLRLISATNKDGNSSAKKIVEHYEYGDIAFVNGDIDVQTAATMHKLTDPRGIETEYEYERTERELGFRFVLAEDLIPFEKRDMIVQSLSKKGTSAGEQDIDSSFEYTGKTAEKLPADAMVTDPRGVLYTYKMDRFGRHLSTLGPTGTETNTWTFEDTLMLSREDENGVLTEYEYDEHGNTTREEVSGPNGGSFVTTSTYTTRKEGTVKNLLESRTDRRGNQTEYDYDGNGNLIEITHPSSLACAHPCVEKFDYFANGDRSLAVDERRNRTRYLYDAYGNVKRTEYPIGTANAAFDLRSRMESQSDENNNTTAYEYDWLNRLVKQTNAEGGIRSYEYDENSNKTDEVDEEGRRMRYGLDFHNRVTTESTLGPGGGSISRSMTYDTNDNLLSVTDYRGNQHVYQYDDANRKKRGTYPPNGTGKVKIVTYDYDNTNNVLTHTESGSAGGAAPQITRYVYDNLYRKTRITDAEGGITQIAYDGNDNVTQQIDELGRVTQYDYDTMNRKTAQRDAVGSPVERSMAWEYDRDSTLLKYIDARGNSESYAYDDKDRQIFKTNLDDNRFSYVYDDYGNLIEEFDHFGNRIAYEYDQLHRRTKVTDQRNFETISTYDLVGNLLTETWPNGNVITRGFDFLDRLVTESDSIGQRMAYSYDDDSNKLSHTDGKGFVTNYGYDALSQLIEERQPEGRTLATEHDVFGNVTKSIDGVGNATNFNYDRLNRQVLLTDADSKTVQSVYDAVDNRLSETDKRGNTWVYQYDELDRVKLTTEPSAGSHDNIITQVYDANDNPIQTIDKRGIVTDVDYDRLNRVVEQRRSGIVVLKNSYSDIGNLVGLEDANGNKTAMLFNDRHEMITESRPEIAISHFVYDSMGDVTQVTDPEGRVSTSTFDARRRKTSDTNFANETVVHVYDLNNNQITKTRPLLNEWAYAYDELNRLIGTTDGEGQSNIYTYDAQNNLLSHTDANGNLSRYEYDVINRKDKMFYPQVEGVIDMCDYTYDPNNNLKVEIDANGQTHTHTYDALNRLTQTEHSNPIVTIGRDLVSETMAYDGNNNVIGVTESYALSGGGQEVRNETKTYDDFDRLFSKTDSWNKILRYVYDLNGNRTALTDSDGTVTTYQYDGLNRIEQVNTVNGRTEYDYDRSSLMSRVSYPNNTQASYQYDPAKRIERIHNQQNSATVSNFEYEYDDNGNRVEQREINGGTEETTNYQYDLNDRLTVVNYPDESVTYTYDPAYNRTSEIHVDTANVTTVNKTYTYNPRNQLSDIEDNLDASNDVAYTFDANGNQTHKVKGTETSNYIFDIRDHLREVTIGGSTVGQFLYDYDGLRIEKLGERGTERSTYDDQSILQQYDSSNTTRAKFDYGPERLLSLNTQGEPASFYLCDALQSVVNLTNNQGAIQARYQYDAWGIKRGEIGTSYNRFAFTGYEEDKETGLLYAKARFYDPDTAKFLSEDAWEGDNMIAPSLHRYLYAYQNPTVYVDPDGNESVTQMIDRGAEGCGVWSCAGWAALSAVYQVGTLGFASVHDPVLEKRDRGEISEGEYWGKGVGGGLAVAGVSLATGRAATPFLVGANTTKAVLVTGAVTGAVEGVAVDALTQGIHISAGVQEDYNAMQTLQSGTIGAVIGTGAAGGGKYLNDRAGATGQKVEVVRESDTKVTPAEVPEPRAKPDPNDLKGGAHRDTSKPVNDGLDSHHCPAKSCYADAPISAQDGPAIKMKPADHRRTASHGSSDEAKAYRAQQKELLDDGKLDEAIQMDVDDVRSKFGDEYDDAIEEMLDYSDTLDPNDFKSE